MEHLQVIPYDQIQMLNKIGQGGYGEVYAALWEQRQVAIKKYKEENSSIWQEEAALTVINHKHIVKLVGTTTDAQNNKMLVMEFMPGGSLGDLLRQPNVLLHRYEILRFALNIATGLAYLHECQPKIVHRDLKPDNILLCADKKRAKITDFGCARVLLKTFTKECIGTMYYLAPEVADNQPYNEKADIYSFGALLYSLLHPTKHLSFYEENRKTQLHAVADDEFKQLMLRCCNLNPKLRPSAAECKQILLKIKHAPRERIEAKLKKGDLVVGEELNCATFSAETIRRQIFQFDCTKEIKIPIRLYISNVLQLSLENVFILLPNLFHSEGAPFGLSHVGVQFGNVMIDWFKNHLVSVAALDDSVRPLATASFEVNDSPYVYYTPQLEKRVVDFIFNWNVNKKFSHRSCDSSIFVSSFLRQALLIDFGGWKFLKPLVKYIELLRNGDASSQPILDSTHHGIMIFDTHEELEEFECERIKDSLLPESERKWTFADDEVKWLKALHRAFQLREKESQRANCCYGPIERVEEVIERNDIC